MYITMLRDDASRLATAVEYKLLARHSPSVRILCLSDEYPWPPTSGYRIRVDNIVRGLALAGSVDLFCTVSERPDLPVGDVAAEAVPQVDGLDRVFVHHRGPFAPRLAGFAAWVRSEMPRAVAWIDWNRAPESLASWAHEDYDLVWFSHCHTWLALGGVQRGPAIVDFDNLEDEKLRTLLRLSALRRSEGHNVQPLPTRIRRKLGAVLDHVDERRWARAQQRAIAAARAVVVCSDLDRNRLGAASVVVLPNGYDLREPPSLPLAVRPEPVLTLVGLLVYPPNLDAAQYFARRVFPLVRKRVPGVRFRIVGRDDGAASNLAELDGVEVLGEVDDLDSVFASTSAVVVPVRAGSGTRIKVLEAFARGLPVVSTTIGCEGIDAVDGKEVLIGDSAESLAACCVRVLTEPALAQSLGEAGHRLWERSYRWQEIRIRVSQLAAEAGNG